MHRLLELPPSVQRYLSDFASRWRRLIALRAVGTALAVLAIWILCACLFDRVLHLPPVIRLGSLFLAATVSICAGIFRLRRLRGEVDWIAIAGTIEQHDSRFSQALITVTSRVLGSPEHRGSDEILAHLLRQVEHQTAGGVPGRILSLKIAARPWLVLVVAMLLMAGLSRWDALGGPQLLARFMSPLSDRPPVTTTQLTLHPDTDSEVMQSEQVRIEVEAKKLGNNPVAIYLNDDAGNWTRYPMDDAGDGRFIYTLSAVGHDLRYYVAGGDATSRTYTLRVKRSPAVAEFRIRYTYPAYTNKSPFTVTSNDGAIDAPTGTDAQITIVSTEPLQTALLTVGEQKRVMEKTGADNIRQTTLHVQNDSTYVLDLISTRDVHGSGTGKIPIHATADHPPAVRLFQAARTLRLNPRDVVPLSFSVRDDYGIVALAVHAQLNADHEISIPIPLTGDRRRLDDTLNLDLSTLKTKIGDVVKVNLVARDTSSQDASSEDLRILIAPRSIDLDAKARIEELAAACTLAASVADSLDTALKALAPQPPAKKSPANAATIQSALSRNLTAASEAATMLRQNLLRAQTHSRSVPLCTTIAAWMDAALQQSQAADDLFRKTGTPEGLSNDTADKLRHLLEQSRELYNQLRIVGQGELAQTVMADREDLKAAQGVPAPTDQKSADELMMTLQHARDEIAGNETALGLSDAAPDIEGQLRTKMTAANALVRNKQPIDFAIAANEWSQTLSRDPHSGTSLEARLAVAAQGEAVRRDADLIHARDLELASRAAGALQTAAAQTPHGKSPVMTQIAAFVADLQALTREHLLSHQPGAKSAEELRNLKPAAARAREELARLAGESAKLSAITSRPGDLESLAIRTGASSARKDFKRAFEEDSVLTQKLTESVRPGGRADSAVNPLVEERVQRIARTAAAVSRQMSRAEAIERLMQSQRATMEARATKTSPRQILAMQRAVAEQAAEFHLRDNALSPTTSPAPSPQDFDWRSRAMMGLILIRDRLASMPAELTTLQETDAAWRKAATRAIAARKEVATAIPDKLRLAQRSADQADQESRECVEQLEKAAATLTPEMANELADDLEPFGPETAAARDSLAGSLALALSSLQTAWQGDDSEAVPAVIVEIRKVIIDAEKDVTRVQNALIERDPLIAAVWLSKAAADTMARRLTDVRPAQLYQNHAMQALTRAWEQSIRRAATLRLAQLPSLQAAFGPPPAGRENLVATAFLPRTVAPTWTPSTVREVDDLAASIRESNPPGYEESLRLYFDALGKSQEKPK